MSTKLAYRAGFLGNPVRPDVPWTRENLARLKGLGFNTIQLNIAWGARPGDEPLNLEDVICLPEQAEAALGPLPLPLDCSPGEDRLAARAASLRERIALCRALGLRTIFHFGSPYNAIYSNWQGLDGGMRQCVLDGRTPEYYVALLEAFGAQFPGVDDILVYTYDQDAWLCSEFGDCGRCRGVPLHERLVPYVNRLVAAWQRINPAGRLWWSPWELSAGQVLQCVDLLEPAGLGLDLHPNIAETIATLPVDRWLKNVCAVAQRRSIPVLVESFLGAASEELEPYQHLAHPLVTGRQVAAIAAVPGVSGIKEYYGLAPDREDANLRMAGLSFEHPEQSEAERLAMLAEPYGEAAAELPEFWRLCSEAQELFPWDTSWFARGKGKTEISHSLSAAFLRGEMCSTPAWRSSRALIFMKIDSEQPHPWMLEDVQLRCGLAADRMGQALALGETLAGRMPPALAGEFTAGLAELAHLRRQVLSYAYHLRETNLATLIRQDRAAGKPASARLVSELAGLLAADYENQQRPYGSPQEALSGSYWIWDGVPETAYAPFVPHHFRKTFTIPSGREIKAAWLLYANSENLLRIEINGALLGAGQACVLPFYLDVTELVHGGENTLAAHVLKAGSDAPRPGIIAGLRIDFGEGAPLRIGTDRTWQVAANWAGDAAGGEWSQATELGAFGSKPWTTKTFGDNGEAIRQAREDLLQDVDGFLSRYFQVAPDTASKGLFTLTSR